MGAMACQLVLKLLDRHRLCLPFGQQKCSERPQFSGAFRQRIGDIKHDESIVKQGFCGNPKTENL